MVLLNFVTSTRLDPYWNLAVENHLLQHSAPDQITLYLWRNQRTVVVGRNQNPYAECRVDLLRADGGYLLRRTTGGGAVFHDGGNLNFSFIVPVDLYDQPRQFSVIQRAVDSYGLHTQRSGRNDLLVACPAPQPQQQFNNSTNQQFNNSQFPDNSQFKKFSGNAFAKGRTHYLHHGTLLIDGNMENLQRYLMPSKAKMAKHGVSSVQSRVVNLSALAHVTVENIQPRLIAACEAVYGSCGTVVDFDTLCADPRVRALHDRYCSDAWLTDGWQDFATTASGHFDWGDVSLSLQVREGRVEQVRIATDALDVDAVDRLQQLLLHATLDQRPHLPADLNQPMATDLLSLIYE